MNPSPRLASIDVFRAITMLLMIFVNDLWSVRGIPGWLEHTAAAADGMGLADTVFPAFLFIVGLSIPFAIQSRVSRGVSTYQSLLYIFTRSFALLLMGVFHVNLEYYDRSALLSRPVWQILITVGFFLVWLDYSPAMKKITKTLLQTAGITILVIMAFIYKGSHNGRVVGMSAQWWGILGLIGWSYLLVASIYLVAKDRLGWLICSLAFFTIFNIAAQLGWLTPFRTIRSFIWIISDGSLPAITMAGVVTSVIYRKFAHNNKLKQYAVTMAVIGFCMLAFGFALRPLGGISKIRATPSWTAICTGISILFFVVLIYIVDIRNKRGWYGAIRPAGTSTLTCYLLPYIHYAIFTLVGITLPIFIRTGLAGIFKCLAYAMLIILVTGLLEKWRIRLRI
jgi:heparan-alpha-glucosaminide N-acetyltransferase